MAAQQQPTVSLSLNAGAMVAIAIVTGALSVIQTLLSNQVGQRVMHDLRAAVQRRLLVVAQRRGELVEHARASAGGLDRSLRNGHVAEVQVGKHGQVFGPR